MITLTTREGFENFRERMCDQLADLPDGLGKKPLHVEQAELEPNTFFTHRLDGTGHHVVYDPRQLPAIKVRIFLDIYATYTEGRILDALRETYYDADCDNMRNLYGRLIHEIDRTQDPDGVINQVAELFARELAEKDEPMAELVPTAGELTAAAICAQLVTEQAELSFGIPVMFRDYGHTVRVAFDPEQTSEAEARAMVILRVGAARSENAGARS